MSASSGVAERRRRCFAARAMGDDGALRLGVEDEPVRLVDDEEVEPRLHRLLREAGLRDEVLERDHAAAVGVERVELRAVVLRDVGAALAVEEDEDLVELPPELAEPLDGERRRDDDEDAVGPLGPDETREDEARLDRLAEAHLVGEEPADRLVGRRPLGDVELVGVDGEPPAEEGAEPLRLPHPLQEEAVEAVAERGGPVDVEAGEPFDGILRDLGGPEAVLLDPAAVRRRPGRRAPLLRGEGHDLPGLLDPGVAPRGELERLQAGVARAERQPLARPRKEDDDPARLAPPRPARGRGRGCTCGGPLSLCGAPRSGRLPSP